jgi:acetyl esterase/lipase
MLRLLALALVALLLNGVVFADPPQPVDVWPGKAPGEKEGLGDEKTTSHKHGDTPIRIVENVSRPTLAVYRPTPDKDTGAAVLICPGGGYHVLAIEHEGEQVATWLNSLGVTGIVLKYRVPRRKDQPAHQAPLQDAQRALSLLRARHKEWGIDPLRLGILGFSAGGHLAAAATTNYDRRAYEPIDEIDKVSCRPDFAVVIYPGYLVGKDGQLSPEIRVTAETPPCFLVHADDDKLSAENSVAMYLALHKAHVPSELHVYTSGGHGFGIIASDHPSSTWAQRCADWMKGRGYLQPRGGR